MEKYKQYLTNPELSIPRTTAWRHRKKEQEEQSLGKRKAVDGKFGHAAIAIMLIEGSLIKNEHLLHVLEVYCQDKLSTTFFLL